MKKIANTTANMKAARENGKSTMITMNPTERYVLNPITNGSEKQNDWAITIKIEMIQKVIKNQETGINQGAVTEEAAIANVDSFVEKLDEIDDAKWFIDNRRESLEKIVQYVMTK